MITPGLHKSLSEAMRAANASQAACNTALAEFSDAILRYDWPAAEAARMKFLGASESYFDEMASMHRAIQIANE